MEHKKIKIISTVIIVLTLSIICIYNYLTNGEKYNKSLDWLLERPIAHRGLFDNRIPENSLGSFNNALQNDFAIELDVMFTKDKKVVVFHDENLERMTGYNKNVSEIDYNELKNLNLKNTSENIPLLKDVLTLVNGKVPILIEIKDCENILELGKATYDITKNYNGKYSIQSFNPFVLEWYKQNVPEVVRGQISGTFTEDKGNLKYYEVFLLKNLMLNFKSKPNFITYELKGLPNFRLEQLRKKGIPTISWTIRSNDDVHDVYKYSDNYVFDTVRP